MKLGNAAWGRVFKAGRKACAKVLGQKLFGVFVEQHKEKCEWKEVGLL